MAFDFDHHDAAHRQIDGIRAQDYGIADDIAGIFQPLHASPHGCPRNTEINSNIRNAASPVMAQKRNQLFIQIVHAFSILKSQTDILINQTDKIANPVASHRQA